jgi:hypothetical protein
MLAVSASKAASRSVPPHDRLDLGAVLVDQRRQSDFRLTWLAIPPDQQAFGLQALRQRGDGMVSLAVRTVAPI